MVDVTNPVIDRLSGWKEIGLYLRRSVRSVQRWERDLKLPIKRVKTSNGQVVFASRIELDAWMTWFRHSNASTEEGTPSARIRVAGRVSRRIRSIAVLPLAGQSTEPGQEFFVDGMTDALIAELSRIQALRVISRTSVMRYRDTTKSASDIAAELDVDALLQGSVVVVEGYVKVQAQVVDADSDRHIWSGSYHRRVEDLPVLHSDVARAIAADIQVRLSSEERAHLDEPRQVNAAAHALWLKGRYLQLKTVWTRNDYEQAFVFFEQSATEDPDYAPAYIGQADICHRLGGYGFWPPKDAFSRARDAANRAAELNPALADAQASVAFSRWLNDWDYAGAERSFLRAISLGSHEAIHQYGSLLSVMGRHEEAVKQYLQALRVNPFSSNVRWGLGKVYRLGGWPDRSVEALRAWLLVEPDDKLALFQLALSLDALGCYDEAVAVLQRVAGVPPLKRFALGALGYVHGRNGHADLARESVSELREMAAAGLPVHGWLALALMGTGEHEDALEALAAAIEAHDSWMPTYMKVEPAFEPLRTHPRFQTLLAATGH